MKYNQLTKVVSSMNAVINGSDTKVSKKLQKFYEKIKIYVDAYQELIQNLRLDNAAVNVDNVLILNEKGDYSFNKVGLKKLNVQLKELGEKEFECKPIEVVNPQGLEDFIFLKDWTTGITFNNEEEL